MDENVCEEKIEQPSGETSAQFQEPTTGFLSELITKCKDWFFDGLCAGFESVDSSETAANVVASTMEAPRRIRESVRAMVDNVVGLVEIPLIASRLYFADLLNGRSDDSREFVLPLNKVSIGLLGTAVVTTTSLAPFRLRRIVPTSPVSPGTLFLTDIKVGKNSQFLLSTKEIPLEIFLNSCPPKVVCEVAPRGTPISLVIRNDSAEHVHFSACLVGDLVL